MVQMKLFSGELTQLNDFNNANFQTRSPTGFFVSCIVLAIFAVH